MIIIIHSYNKKCYPLPGYLLQKNITKILLPECLDFLFKIPSEHKIILSQDRSLANLFISLPSVVSGRLFFHTPVLLTQKCYIHDKK